MLIISEFLSLLPCFGKMPSNCWFVNWWSEALFCAEYTNTYHTQHFVDIWTYDHPATTEARTDARALLSLLCACEHGVPTVLGIIVVRQQGIVSFIIIRELTDNGVILVFQCGLWRTAFKSSNVFPLFVCWAKCLQINVSPIPTA